MKVMITTFKTTQNAVSEEAQKPSTQHSEETLSQRRNEGRGKRALIRTHKAHSLITGSQQHLAETTDFGIQCTWVPKSVLILTKLFDLGNVT